MPRLRWPRRLDRKPPPLPGARIVVGLGNPGVDYARQRHNVGARGLEQLSQLLGLPLKQRGNLFLSGQGRSPYGPLVLARPRTLMNESGRTVQALLSQHRARPADLILILDDLDLAIGQLRIRARGGDAGHRGMRSIKERIGTLDFPRVRIGIGRPAVDGVPSHDPAVVADHVLSDPDPQEAAALQAAERRAAEAVIAILRDGVEAAMNTLNAD